MDRLPDTGTAPAEIVVQACPPQPVRPPRPGRPARGSSSSASAAARRPTRWRPRSGRRRPAPSSTARSSTVGLPIDDVRRRRPTQHGLPVLVDASMNLPPRANLRRFIDGRRRPRRVQRRQDDPADRRRRGSSPVGRTCSSRSACSSRTWTSCRRPGPAARCSRPGADPAPPQHGIGRSMKTGKEEIVGLLVALRALRRPRRGRRGAGAGRRSPNGWPTGLGEIPGLDVATEPAQADGRPVPMTIV